MLISQLLILLEKLRNEHQADEVKVYFTNELEYCIKIIKDEKVIHTIRKRNYVEK